MKFGIIILIIYETILMKIGSEIMIRYYCSGFDANNAFGHGLGDMFKTELRDTKSIVYIPGSPEKIEKAKTKYIPVFTNHFKNVGIEFDEVNLITTNLKSDEAKEIIKNASFIMLMGGNPFKQKEMCEKLGILEELKRYNGIMVGFSAGAMLMSKYIIITPCNEEYPDFHVEDGLNFDGLSIYPHNNTFEENYPDTLVVGDETYQKKDLIQVAKKYGKFFLLQDNGIDISIIKSSNGNIEFYIENDGKIWEVSDEITLVFKNQCKKK